jgi:hypothetical protein
MALSRDERYVAPLEQLVAEAKDATLAEGAKDALAVVKGGDLRGIRDEVKAVCQDTLDRERFFGRSDR